MRAADLRHGEQTESSLRRTLAHSNVRAHLVPADGARFVAADVSPDGKRVALVLNNGVAEIRALPSLEVLGRRPAGANKLLAAYFRGLEDEVVLVGDHWNVSRWNFIAGTEGTAAPGASAQALAEPAKTMRSNPLIRLDGAGLRMLDLDTESQRELRSCVKDNLPLAAKTDGTAILLAFETSKGISICDGTSGEVTVRVSAKYVTASFSPFDPLLVTFGGDEKVRVWDLSSGKEVATLRGFTALPREVVFVEPRTLAISVWGGVVEIRRFSTGYVELDERVAQFRGTPDEVRVLAGVAGGRLILGLHESGELRLWEGLRRGPDAESALDRGIAHAALGASGRLVAVADDGSVHDLTPKVGRRVLGAPRGESKLVGIAPSPSRKRVLLAWEDGTVHVWELEGAKLTAEIREKGPLLAAAWASRDEAVVTTLSADGLLRLHEKPGVEEAARSWTLPTASRRPGLLSPDRQRWITQDGSVVDLGSMHMTRLGAELPPRGWPFAGNDDLVAVSSEIPVVQGLAHEKTRVSLRGHAARVTDLQVSPDGSLIVSASDDWTARLYDARTGAPLSSMQGHTDPVTQATFRTDGKLVVTLSRDWTLRVWEPFSATQLMRIDIDSEGEILDFEGGTSCIGLNPTSSGSSTANRASPWRT